MSATYEHEQGRKYARLVEAIAELERAADRDTARELAMARAHIERAARLAGVDTASFPRVAHGGTDLREPTCSYARDTSQLCSRVRCSACPEVEGN